MQPNWMDHHYLNFWLWACLHDAEAYLESRRQETAAISSGLKDWAASQKERLSPQRHRELYQYHFVITTGSLVKHLTRLAPLFPSIQPAFEAAEHLKKGGLYLRKRLIPLSQVVPHLAFEERRTRSGAGAGILREA
jgi:hypothetical protein